MKLRALFLLIGMISFALPVGAKEVTGAKKARHPAEASKSSYRAAAMSCRDEGGELAALGLVHLASDVRNPDAGFFGLTVYVRTSKGQLSPKSLSGPYTTVPNGYILRADWTGAPGDQVLVHVHPRDKTYLPGVAQKLSCAIDGQLDQL